MKRLLTLAAIASLMATGVAADEAQELYERGQELYNLMNPASCGVCHSADGSGGAGPTIQYGPAPDVIYYQLTNNPQMGPLNSALKPTNDDLLALSVYIKTLDGNTALADVDIQAFKDTTLNIMRGDNDLGVAFTPRDEAIEQYQTFKSVLDTWERKSQTGNLMRTFETITYATFDPGDEIVFNPDPDKVYFVENTGISASLFGPRDPDRRPALTSKVVIGDAATKEVLVYGDIPTHLRGDNHFTALTPDGKYVYITGGRPVNPDGSGGMEGEGFPMQAMMAGEDVFSTALSSILKVDIATLQPVKQFNPGGRVHHMQIFREKYMLVDTFGRDPNGLDVFILDPETDEVLGGIRDEELGGITYTSFTDDKFIYILMQPDGYPGGNISGYTAGIEMGKGKYMALRPFWVAKVNPDTWEVVGEYPYPGYRGDWITIDDNEVIYVPAGASSNVSKIDTRSGQVLWTTPTGIGPYGAALNADGTELWVADKGETTGMFGRTVTVIDTEYGHHLETLFSAYQVDHILLSPDGKEFWATSNAEGRLYVYDAATRELTHRIDMPERGDAHGLVWAQWDEDGNGRVLRDQGNFHSGINPRLGQVASYQ